MSLLCVAPSHLSICIATFSPSLKHRVSSHRFPSHQPPYLPPPSFPSSPKLTSSTPPNHLRLSAVRSKYQDVGYLTHHWCCWSAPSKVLLADWQRLIFTQTHSHTQIYMYDSCPARDLCAASLNQNIFDRWFSRSLIYFHYVNVFFRLVSFFLSYILKLYKYWSICPTPIFCLLHHP